MRTCSNFDILAEGMHSKCEPGRDWQLWKAGFLPQANAEWARVHERAHNHAARSRHTVINLTMQFKS